MRFVLNLDNRLAMFLVGILAVVSAVGIVTGAAPNPGHDPAEIGPGTFGSGDFTFRNNLNILGGLTVVSDVWAKDKVGIGTANPPQERLEVNGNINVTGSGTFSSGIKANWDSGWFPVVLSTEYSKTHDLGTKDYIVWILYRENSASTYYNIVDFQQPYRNTWGGANEGAVVLEQADNYIKIRTGNKYVNGIGYTDLAAQYYKTSGEYRILLFRFA